MRVPQVLVALLVTASLSLIITTSAADGPDDIPLIGFDFENGQRYNESMLLSGFIEDEIKPTRVSWRMDPTVD